MKRIVCELCGSSDIIKQDGVFMCQSCGTKYSLEEARKMMVEVSGEEAPPAAKPSSDNTAQVSNYLKLAENATESGNYQEAEKYANEVLEKDPNNADAWFIKGKAAGWQSTVGNVRFTESTECWAKACEFASDEHKEELKTKISNEIVTLAKALIATISTNFGNLPVDSNVASIKNSCSTILTTIGLLIVKTGIKVDLNELNEFMAQKINVAAVAGFGGANKAFGPERRDQNRFAYTTWLEKVTNCSEILVTALTLAEDPKTIKQIYENIEFINNEKIKSKSYKFSAELYGQYIEDTSLTETAKTYCRNVITKAKADMNKKLEAIKNAEEAAKEARIKAYWDERPEEKAKLEKERDELKQQLDPINKEIRQLRSSISVLEEKKAEPLPIDDEIDALMKDKLTCEAEKRNLGMFKSREKAELQSRIDGIAGKVAQLKEQCEAEKQERNKGLTEEIAGIYEKVKPLEAKKAELDKKIDVINIELTMDRK